ncbi:hypothetical protein TRAPUB_5028 [Trametes pubescens]|uniref:Uncharacterized protein n=1 Tax=Trametes pubescens TaxID=154538 RepID=A0A1M2V9K9_TRAPU|nr:hypothetical protein TRAPUB_5028 [Trametes pubescens]
MSTSAAKTTLSDVPQASSKGRPSALEADSSLPPSGAPPVVQLEKVEKPVRLYPAPEDAAGIVSVRRAKILPLKTTPWQKAVEVTEAAEGTPEMTCVVHRVRDVHSAAEKLSWRMAELPEYVEVPVEHARPERKVVRMRPESMGEHEQSGSDSGEEGYFTAEEVVEHAPK